MFDYEFVKTHTQYCIEHKNGNMEYGTFNELYKKQAEYDDVKNFGRAARADQPKELQDFYEKYDYAIYYQNRREFLYNIEAFYNEYVKNPNQFMPEHRPVIGKLSEELDNIDKCDDVLVQNYDKQTVGPYPCGNFVEALAIIDTDFDVTSIDEDKDTKIIITQEYDLALFARFENKTFNLALLHHKCTGDGKYCKK